MTSMATLVIATRPGTGFTGSRFLAPWGSTTLLSHSLDEVRSWPVDEHVLVLGDSAESLVDATDLSDFDVIVDPEWEEGDSASYRSGIDFLMRTSEVGAVVLVDAATPGVSAGIVAHLVESHDAQDRPITIGRFRYTARWPVIVDRELWPRLLGLEGDAGIDTIMSTHRNWVNEHWVDSLPPRAVVTPDDLAELGPRH